MSSLHSQDWRYSTTMESNPSFESVEWDYYAVGAGGDEFIHIDARHPTPRQGYKIHRLAGAEYTCWS